MPVVTESTFPHRDAPSVGMHRAQYPFAAIIGHPAAKRALLLLAVEPRLRGALISSNGGSDESVLARAFAALLTAPALDWTLGGVVDLPLSITEDRLLGELDLERTIATGEREISNGLLARANGRVLFANDINLLDSGVAAHVAQAIDSRCVRVEREGIGATQEADFRFVGVFNSNEGEPLSLLRERVGLIVDSAVVCSSAEKAEIIKRALRFENDPDGFAEEFAFATGQLKGEIEAARARLPRVRASSTRVRQISQTALRLGVEGNRADVFALKAARASAALAGRNVVTDDDLLTAIQLVLVPRATTLPLPRGETQEEREPAQNDAEKGSRPDAGQSDSNSLAGSLEDMIVQAIDSRVPDDLLPAVKRAYRPSRAGKRFKGSPSARGRYVRSVTSAGRDARIAIDATLRAAAPYQQLRRVATKLDTLSAIDSDSPNLDTTARTRRVRIEPNDLRFKEFKHRSGILFIFAVDASGSMALNRMAQAKGAIARLLQQAYLHRDMVALISFRGAASEVLLGPTRSVELARRLVDSMPAGGGTPLAAGVMKAIELARLSRLRGVSQAMLVLFTDGRANVGLRDRRSGGNATTIDEELSRLGGLIESEEMLSVVVDTKSRFVSNGEAEALAHTLGSRYVYLPRADADAVYRAITSISRRPRKN